MVDSVTNLSIGSVPKPAIRLNSENKLLNCLRKFGFQDKNFWNGENDYFLNVLTWNPDSCFIHIWGTSLSASS